MYFAPSPREKTPSEMVIHRLYEITSHYDAGFEQQMMELLQLGLDRFELDIGIVSHIQGETYEVVAAVAPAGVQLGKGDTFEFAETYCSVTVGADGPVGFERAGETSFASHPAYGIFKLESYIGIPLYKGPEFFGTLNFSSAAARERKFEEVDLDSLKLMGSWLSTELLRRQMEEDLYEAQRHLEHLVRTDPLTELENRRGVADRLEGVTRRSALNGEPVSCVLVDIDDFKSVNDRFGHSTGDRIIRAVADMIRASLRPGDLAGRVGGDEFVAVLAGASEREALQVAERIGKAVRSLEVTEEGQRVPITVSIGVTQISSQITSVTEVLAQTQKLLSESKKSGKNRVTGGALTA